jgi:transcriptional regulator with XRE-family HTH domain
MFLKALRKVAAAQPRPIAELAELVGVSRESLYRMMSEAGNPTYENLTGILSAMGFKMKVEPIASITVAVRPSSAMTSEPAGRLKRARQSNRTSHRANH